MSFVWIGIAAFLGGVVKGLIGWSRSQEPFVFRKFVGTLLTTVIVATSVSLVYASAISIGIPDVLLAFLAGAGADNLRKEVANNIRINIEKEG